MHSRTKKVMPNKRDGLCRFRSCGVSVCMAGG